MVQAFIIGSRVMVVVVVVVVVVVGMMRVCGVGVWYVR